MLLVLATLAGLSLPGYLILRGLRIPPVVALSAAPAILAGVLAALSVILPGSLTTGRDWATTAWIAAGVLSAVGVLLWLLSPRLAPDRREPSRLFIGIALGAAALACIITAHQVLEGMGALDVPLQRRDSVFHYNAIAGIFNGWGSANPLELQGWMLGSAGTSSFYPSTFHAVAATIPVAHGVVAGNLLAVVCCLVWVIGLTGLARVAFPSFPGAWAAAPLLSLVAISFPLIPMFRQGQWPFGLSLALTPGLLALLMYSARTRSIPGLLAFCVGLAGSVGAHPSGIAVFALVTLGAAMLEIGERALAAVRREDRAEARMALPLAIVLAFGAAGAYVVLDRSETILRMGTFARPQTPAPELVQSLLTFSHVSVNEPFGIAPAIGMIPLLIAGTALMVIYRPSRPLFVAASMLLVTLLLTPTNLRVAHVTGALWYGDPERILGVLTLFTLLAAALGVGWLAEKIAPRVRGDRDTVRMGVSLLIVALALSITWIDRSQVRSGIIAAGNYHPSETSPHFVGGPAWTADDSRFWESAAELVGTDGVMTDSASGGVLLPAMVNVRAVPAITTLDSMPGPGREAAWGLRDPQPLGETACLFLEDNTIRWVYLEKATNTRFAGSHFRSDLMAPHGELVVKDGPRELWRIDDCRN